MWRATVGKNVDITNPTVNNDDDDEWETDPDFVVSI